MSKATSKQLLVWEIRQSADGEHGWDDTTLKQWFGDWCKKWVYQLEKSDDGYLHYQGRVSLIKPLTLNGAKKHCKNHKMPMYFEPTISKEHRKDAFYCMKMETRVEGPFRDDDPEPKQMTRQLKEFLTFEHRPYQANILLEATKPDNRRIDIIYDSIGNCGKSILSEYLEYKDIAEEVPPFRAMEDIMGWVCTRPIKPVYIFDMPRGMKKDKLADFYAGIECIKNGIAFDKRYSAKKVRFDRPRVFVFTNSTPVFELLSADRWVIWNMLPNYDVDIYTPEQWEETFRNNPIPIPSY